MDTLARGHQSKSDSVELVKTGYANQSGWEHDGEGAGLHCWGTVCSRQRHDNHCSDCLYAWYGIVPQK